MSTLSYMGGGFASLGRQGYMPGSTLSNVDSAPVVVAVAGGATMGNTSASYGISALVSAVVGAATMAITSATTQIIEGPENAGGGKSLRRVSFMRRRR